MFQRYFLKVPFFTRSSSRKQSGNCLKDTELYNYSVSNGKIVIFGPHCILLYDVFVNFDTQLSEHWLLLAKRKQQKNMILKTLPR